jgi:hypothetical protein
MVLLLFVTIVVFELFLKFVGPQQVGTSARCATVVRILESLGIIARKLMLKMRSRSEIIIGELRGAKLRELLV